MEEDWKFFTLNLAHWAVGFRDAALAKSFAEAFEAGMSPRDYLKWLEFCESVDLSGLLPQVSSADPGHPGPDGSALGSRCREGPGLQHSRSAVRHRPWCGRGGAGDRRVHHGQERAQVKGEPARAQDFSPSSSPTSSATPR